MITLLRLLTIGLLLILIPACATSESTQDEAALSPRVRAVILARTDHILKWTGYHGRSSPEDANYTIDGQSLGSGSTGLANLRSLIAEMPDGSLIRIGLYYSGEDERAYPFNTAELSAFSDRYGVTIGVPGGG